MPVRVRDISRKTRRERRREEKRNFPVKTAALAAALFAGLSGGVMVAYNDLGKVKPDELACYPTSEPQAQTAALVDSSEPRFTPVQRDDLITAFEDHFKYDFEFNERVRVFTTDESNIGTVPDPVLELCAGARTSAELEDIGAASATQAYLDRQRDKTFNDTVLPVLDGVFATHAQDGKGQQHETPLLEQFQNISRMRGFSDADAARRLIVVSDLLHNTRDAQFCFTSGHLPAFSRFKESTYYQRIKPRSLEGVEVTLYMLVRPGLGAGDYQYCTEAELADWWQDFFTEAGASSVEIIRLRDASYVSRQ